MSLPTLLIIVEDEVDEMPLLRKSCDVAGQELAKRGGPAMPPFGFWGPTEALERIRGNPAAGEKPVEWSGTELLAVDCWNRDATDDDDGFRSTFFALDLLDALRERKEANHPVPRVLAHSRGMGDAMLRAALGEFMHERERVELPAAAALGIKWGTRLSAPQRGEPAGVLWAIFERSVLEENLLAIMEGDLAGAASLPLPSDPVWSEFLPSSCLASFHREVRDDYPEAWRDHVLARHPVRKLTDRERTGIRRAGYRYLEPNEARGRPSYKGYVEIARRLAMPG